MKTIHEFLESKGVKSIGTMIPALGVEQYIKEYCYDLLVFCAENAELDYEKYDSYDALSCQVDKESILKIKDLI